jgi:formylglycine-generating enzyme required for sulfatase activity
MRMLSKDARERPQTCAEVIKELSDVLSNESLEQLASELGQLVQELFPKEPSDADVTRKVTQFVQGGRIDGEPGTAVDLDRIRPVRVPSIERSSQTPVHIREPTVRDHSRAPWLLFGILLSAMAWVGWVKWKEKHDSAKAQAELLTANSERETGPVDQDLRDAIRKRQTEVEAKIRDLQDQVDEAERKAATTEEELQKAKIALQKKQIETIAVPVVSKGACPKDMVRISAGKFIFGSGKTDQGRNELVEAESQSIFIQAFCIDRYEFPNRKSAKPLSNVDWNRAQELCAKASKRLCLQEEWERACKGPGSYRFPYGNHFDARNCNVERGDGANPTDHKVSPSGSFEKCVSNDDVFDLTGNLDEWTGSLGRFNPQARVIKGGSYSRPSYQARCAAVREVEVAANESDVGFRCCKDLN